MCACNTKNCGCKDPRCHETKFSKIVVPSFLCDRVKSRSKPNMPKTNKTKIKTKDIGVGTYEEPEVACEAVCNCCQPCVLPSYDSMWQTPCVLMNPMNPAVNQTSLQRLRPAGLPSKRCTPFDPCTGMELRCQPPCTPFGRCSVNLVKNIQIQDTPSTIFWQEEPTESNELLPPTSKPICPSNNCIDKANKGVRRSNSCCRDKCVNKAICQTGKRSLSAAPKATERYTFPAKQKLPPLRTHNDYEENTHSPYLCRNNMTGQHGSNELKLVNCCNASPDFLNRICESLRVPQPPESCYILLPITMATSSKKKTRQSGKSNNEWNNNEEEGSSDKSNSKPEDEFQEECPPRTRTCGCNTEAVRNCQAKDGSSEADNVGGECKNACGSCCTAGCCYWPRRTCYYNPFTGRYCWYNHYCCSSGCNSCAGANQNSCALPAAAKPPQSKKESSKRETLKSPRSSAVARASTRASTSQPRSSKKDDRNIGGGEMPFPSNSNEEVQHWMGYSQHMDTGFNHDLMSVASSRPPTSSKSYATYSKSFRSLDAQQQDQPQEQMQEQQQQKRGYFKGFRSRMPSMMMMTTSPKTTDID
ncbi:uncharacterized protein LOC111597294 isoform X2 [Drosophila hydei]|uniref:Uncharacterized protein LOC111597294 isoform X2 n=1 Tax=Drosophila hydei TaxID=7224 RepID=A0A6J1LRM9_DROHY|nr:uncharacterized protein LOC111597294 isoform X2 [Drosophila hydei]